MWQIRKSETPHLPRSAGTRCLLATFMLNAEYAMSGVLIGYRTIIDIHIVCFHRKKSMVVHVCLANSLQAGLDGSVVYKSMYTCIWKVVRATISHADSSPRSTTISPTLLHFTGRKRKTKTYTASDSTSSSIDEHIYNQI